MYCDAADGDGGYALVAIGTDTDGGVDSQGQPLQEELSVLVEETALDGADEHDGGVLVATGAEEDDADNNPEQNVETPNNDNFSSQSSFLSSSSSNSGNRLISDFASFDENEYDCIKYMLTNSRSLSPKVLSLVAYFEELELDLALITESWLADGSRLDQDIAELEHGTDLSVLYKNRPLKPNSRRRTSGGGVALVYNKIKCQFKEVRLKNNRFEMICARGVINGLDRKVVVVGLIHGTKNEGGHSRGD